jgi:hypothetical protein
MFDRLDRISGRTACALAAAGLGLSVIAALLVPQDAMLGSWVRLVIWHGMLSAASIVGVIAMGALAAAYIVTRSDRIGEWARALQVSLLPLWGLALLIGAASARLVWNSWNLTERRMVMSIAYIVVAALALMVGLLWEDRTVGALGQLATALAMAAGLAWIWAIPAAEDVHPASAILSSTNLAFKAYALVMLCGCLLMVFSIAVLTRRWLARAGVGE